MDNTELRYGKISADMKDFDQLNTLYNTAFPAAERAFTIKEAMDKTTDDTDHEAAVVYDGDDMVGFYAISCRKGYKYLEFIAVNPNIRSKGYGGRILKKLLDDNKDIVFFASIEKPDPNGKDFEIKKRRQEFYERNGMITVNRSRIVNGVEYIIVTNKTGEKFEQGYENMVKEERTYFE